MAKAIRAVSWLSLFPLLTLFLFLTPILAGLTGVLLPAFGYFPDLGGTSFHWGVFQQLLEHPSLPESTALTLFTSISSTVISLYIATKLAAMYDAGLENQQKKSGWSFLYRGLVPIIAVPHAAMALGLAFLLAPSGWLIRLIANGTNSWMIPPQIITIQDEWGISLIAGLVLKETPYLLLMMLTASSQIKTQAFLKIGKSMGYSNFQSWKKLILPQLFPLIRLPVYAVLAFSISVVDVAIILGPSTPPTLSVLMMRWIENPDLSFRFTASAAAVLMLILTLGSILGARFLEWLLLKKRHHWMIDGKRGRFNQGRKSSAFFGFLLLGLASVSMLLLALWSLTLRWPYPEIFPVRWSLRTWERHGHAIQDTISTTLWIGMISVLISVILVVGSLENEKWNQKLFSSRALLFLYLPLLVPQATFLLGVQILSVKLRLDGTYVLMIWSHLLFVLPYIFLSLGDSWRNLDPRYITIAQCLGASKWKILVRVKFPILLKSLLIASAIGFSVSISLYLPTLFAGAGRFATLTTEAVSYAAGADRRIIGVYGFLQALFPWMALLLASWIPRWKYRQRASLS